MNKVTQVHNRKLEDEKEGKKKQVCNFHIHKWPLTTYSLFAKEYCRFVIILIYSGIKQNFSH